MAGAAASVAMVLVVLPAILSSGIPAAHAGTNFISRTCRRTQDAALCVALLSADPRSAHIYNVHGLADILLDNATDTALENGGVFNLIYFKYAWTPEGNAAGVCRAAYHDAARKLVFDARDNFDDGYYVRASQLVARAQLAGDRCQDAFKGVSEMPPAADMNRRMTERCIVARGLIDRLASTSCCCSCSQKCF